MKNNRMMWVLVLLVVSVTIAVTFGNSNGSSQRNYSLMTLSPTPDAGSFRDLTKYAVVDYNETQPQEAAQLQKRKAANERYDKQDWVIKTPNSGTDGVGRYDETPPPPLIPTDESDLIVIGTISEVSAHMSNDKQGVYSEFTIRIEKILKNDAAKNVSPGGTVTADREGGYVRYPNGQKIFYESSDKALPVVWGEYVLFLTNDKLSPNYRILTLYELKGDSIVRLDDGRNFDQFKDASKKTFIEAIRDKISKPSVPIKN